MSVEDGAHLEQTAQHRTRAAEEPRCVHPAGVCERPGAVEREGERAAVRRNERLRQLELEGSRVKVKVTAVTGPPSALGMREIGRGVKGGEGWRQRRDGPCAFGGRIVLRRACVVGIGEEER